jgi:tRNA U34 5-methylaminomethyl-2-thiouridine-forming methyltransferase MnmC
LVSRTSLVPFIPTTLKAYELVQLKNGSWSVRSTAEGETFHPVIGPIAEAETLYVDQLQLVDRFRDAGAAEFVIWDIGLGAGANALTALKRLRPIPGKIRLISFDHTLEPLRFALSGAKELGFLDSYEAVTEQLVNQQSAGFENGANQVRWEVHVQDFPAAANSPEAMRWPKPHAILYDAFSPAKNPVMWTLPLFERLLTLTKDGPECVLATYSRATMLRATLLLAGWYVGAGSATGEKEETTVAATSLHPLRCPLDEHWLVRARRSTSAEPLTDGNYRQAKLSDLNWQRLVLHPQFAGPQTKLPA